ncbi:toprim domain-containing protein (plasmid) [Paenibacillus urinalis]|uniref:Toprim domain-containing protein n=1 Tax=Paenibacillus urinalis TaxID=521520 RepID=A0AAX3N6K4_9BACL|nr:MULTISPECIES: toprim domain-containing protein [Paenibacillus]MCM3130563.1 toprim domain-containing protein [Paenibacillus sp. MER 78]WDH85450.1 toprim domain-containing protein [Paenibacillus urinalis]WDH95111.1 toprim domain-containing protein [Paenibacillus urinalis]
MRLRRTRHADWFEIMSLCPICGKKGWCAINKDQTIVHCMRVPSDKYKDSDIGRQYTHYLTESAPRERIEIELSNAVEKRSNDHLNHVYRTFTKEVPLSTKHASHLRSDRMMDEDSIRMREYRTMPERDRYKVAKGMIGRLSSENDLLGVPGFFAAEGRYGAYWTIAGNTGLMVPYRSIRNEITGWQIRVDKPPLELSMQGSIKGEIMEEVEPLPNGLRRAKCSLQVQDKTLEVILTEKDKKICHSKSGQFVFSVKLEQGTKYWWWSSGSKMNGASIGGPLPVHLALPYPCLPYWKTGEDPSDIIDCSEVWVTEGALKADLAADLMVKPFFAVPGTGAFRLALEPLKELGCKHVVLAFDADAVTTPEVQRSLELCAEFFAKESDMALSLAMWDVSLGKGIDDLLRANYVPQVSSLLS